MSAFFSWENVGERSTTSGAEVIWTSSYLSDPDYTHGRGPNLFFWDGHAASTVAPAPIPAQRFKLRPNFTADFTGVRH